MKIKNRHLKKFSILFFTLMIFSCFMSDNSINVRQEILSENDENNEIEDLEIDRTHLASGSTHIWNYTTGDWVQSVSISADGNYLVAGSRDNKVYLFNISSSTPEWIFDATGNGGDINSVAISADSSSER